MNLGSVITLAKLSVLAAIFTLLQISTAFAVDLVPKEIKIDGFVDAYYAYDFNHPPTYDRAFTTQPARSDEFNINLASIGLTLTQERTRARIALQAGTSVQSNYAAEPAIGTVSGASLSRSIQEAYAGYKLSEKLWIDAGTYFSHVGAESFISRDNLSYTRSLVADYSPYYQNGVRLSYTACDSLSMQLHLINGWQNSSENNRSKMFGSQVSYQASPSLNLTYNTLVGRESEFRHFHDFILKFNFSDALELVAQYDIGFQRAATGSSFDHWGGALAIMRFKTSAVDAFHLRVENFRDPAQLIILTGLPDSFEVVSSSIGYDRDLSKNLKWRSELRGFWAKQSIYPTSSGAASGGVRNRDSVAVTSFAATF